MKRMILVGGCIIVPLLFATALAEPPNEQPRAVTIPLDQIWAMGMPRTRDVRELEPEYHGDEFYKLPAEEQSRIFPDALFNQIGNTLDPPPTDALGRPAPRTDAGPAFAVLGSGKEALRRAHAVMVEKQPPQNTFPAGSEITVVFFSRRSGVYVHLDKVARKDDIVTIQYRFVPHETKNLSSHWALIPIGKPPLGEIRVEIVPLPLEKKYVAWGFREPPTDWAKRLVSKSFGFSVVESADDK